MRSIASRALWPVFVIGSTVAYAVGFASGWGSLTVPSVPAATVTLLLLVELAIPADPNRFAYRDPQVLHDIGHSLIGQAIGSEIGRVLFLLGAGVVAGMISEAWGGNLWPATWPFALQAFLLVVIADGLDYWRHRAQHTLPWLWPIHALHHNTHQLNALKSGRTHLLDMTFRSLVVYAPLIAIGVPADVLLWYPAAVAILGPIGHSNIDIRLPSFLHRIVLTPQEHRIHHAGDLKLGNSNFANVFPFWDILGGTFAHPDEHPAPTFGTPGDPMPTSFLGQLLAPFVWSRLVQRDP